MLSVSENRPRLTRSKRPAKASDSSSRSCRPRCDSPDAFPSRLSVWEAVTKAYPSIFDIPPPNLEPFELFKHLIARNSIAETPGQPGRAGLVFGLSYQKRHLIAVFLQVCGDVRTGVDRCWECAQGKGIWNLCVVVPHYLKPKVIDSDPLTGACACCYHAGRRTTCSLVSKPSRNPFEGATTTNSNIVPDPMLVAYYRSMSDAKRLSLSASLNDLGASFQDQLLAVQIAYCEFDDDGSTVAAYANPILNAHYRAMHRDAWLSILGSTDAALKQVETQLDACLAAARQVQEANREINKLVVDEESEAGDPTFHEPDDDGETSEED